MPCVLNFPGLARKKYKFMGKVVQAEKERKRKKQGLGWGLKCIGKKV